MDWKAHYAKHCVDPIAAVEHVKSGDRVVAANFGGTPEGLLDALVTRADDLKDVEIVHMVSMGKCEYMKPDHSASFRHNALFAGATSRQCIWEGRGDYTPCFFHEIPSMFRQGIMPVDVAFVTVSPPDRMGNLSLGIAVDYSIQACLSAKNNYCRSNRTYAVHKWRIHPARKPDRFFCQNRPPFDDACPPPHRAGRKGYRRPTLHL